MHADAAELSAIRDEWIATGLAASPAEHQRAEAAVQQAYRQAGRAAAVRVIWAESPIGGAAVAANLRQRDSGLRAALDVAHGAFKTVRRRAESAVAPELAVQIHCGVTEPVAAVTGHVADAIAAHLSAHVPMALPDAERGQHDAPILAAFDALGRCGLDVSELRPMMELARSSSWWWAFDDVCVLTERPSLLNLDEIGRLHASHGPAVTYPDGWSLYAWHGVVVDPAVVQHPERITLARIKREPNPDIRRVLLERYGWARYVDDSGALPAHADDTGTLYRCDIGCGEPLVLVSVVDEAVGSEQVPARLVLRVPPDITQACQAVEWALMQLEE